MPPQQGGGVTTHTNNIAAAEITGVEIENNVRLVAGLTAFLNYAYTDAKYTRYSVTTIDSAGNVRRNIDSPYAGAPTHQLRSEARRVWKACLSPCSSSTQLDHQQIQTFMS